MAETFLRVNRLYRRRLSCWAGHRFTPATTYQDKHGRRMCRICRNARLRGRAATVIVGSVQVSIVAHDRFFRLEQKRLRAKLVAAHPDKGGTSAKFIAAKNALDAFLTRETAWYTELGLTMPTAKRRLGAAA